MEGRILLIEDDADYTTIFTRLLGGAGFVVESAGSAAQGNARVQRESFDAVCLDLGLPDADGLGQLQALQATDPHLPVVILTADSAVSTVVAAMHEGAYDYLVKNVDRTKLVTTMKNAVARRRLETRVQALEKSAGASRYGIIGATPAMRALFSQIDRVGASDVTVAILGESGSGKELVAHAVHDASDRRTGPFVAINCAAIPETLQEAELFGHEKGAFTGAQTRRVGRLEQAHEGTLFLDEVAELSLTLQAKLLRALQERRFTRVGGTQEVVSNFRVVAASHKDLAAEVSAGRFREDLYYRLVVFELRVPPLRERPEDIPLLAAHFLSRFPDADGRVLRLAPDALEAFLASPWRGNVRELQNAIQHAAVVAQAGVVRRADLPPRLRTAAVEAELPVTTPRTDTPLTPGAPSWPHAPIAPAPAPPAPLRADPPGYALPPSPWMGPPPTPTPVQAEGWGATWPPLPAVPSQLSLPPTPVSAPSLPPSPTAPPSPSDASATQTVLETEDAVPKLPPMRLDELERLMIIQAIERHRGNLSAAIRELGLGRTTIYRKLKEYGIQVR